MGKFDRTVRKPAVWVVLFGLLVAATAFVRGESEKRISPKQVFKECGWLHGEWKGNMWGGEFVAYYSTPEGGKILSHSRLLKDGKVAFYEFEIFEPEAEIVRLQPYPGGRPAVGFQLKSHDPKVRKLVFENPEKDYPTRIVYHRVADKQLVITLSDPFGKSDKVEKFDLRRVAPK